MSAIPEIHLSEEELEVLITLDDPVDAPQEDAFNRLQAENNDPYRLTFGQGDWTCTLSRLTEPLNKKFDIEVCTVTHWKDGEIVEQKVFYDLVGTRVSSTIN